MKRKVVFVQVRYLQVGWGAQVIPLNHPSALVRNGGWAHTSPVLRINPDGSFETQNHIYVPMTAGDWDSAEEKPRMRLMTPD